MLAFAPALVRETVLMPLQLRLWSAWTDVGEVAVDTVARALVLVSLLAAGLLVIAGPVYGFDVPRLGVIATTLVAAATLVAPQTPALVREADRTQQALLAASGVLLVWTVLATVLGEVPLLSWLGQQSRFIGGVALTAPILLVVVLPVIARTARDVDRWLAGVVAVLAAGALYSLVQWAGLDPMPWAVNRGGAPVGFYGNTNFVGAVLGPATALAWWLWTRGQQWRMPAVALAVGSWLAMYAAGVRLGAVAAAGAATVIVIGLLRVSDRRWQGWFLTAVPVGGVLGGSAVVAVAAAFGDRNGIARVSFWRTAERMWADAPLLGQGVGRFDPNYRRFRAPEEVTVFGVVDHDLPVDTSHNFLVDLAATAGTPAALAWLAALVAAGLLLRRGWLSSDGPTQVRFLALAAALGAHSVQSAISVPIVTTVYLGWFLVGLTLAASLAQDRAASRSAGKQRRRRPNTRSRSRERRKRVTRAEVVSAVVAGVLAVAVAIPAFSVWQTTRDLGTASSTISQEVTDAALVFASSANQRSPWWPEPWHLTGEAAQAEGDLELAREAGERAVAVDPLDRRGRYLLIQLDQADDLEAVGELLTELRRIDPNGLDLHFDVLQYARVVGDDDLAEEAVQILEQVIDEDHPRWQELEGMR